MKRILLPFLLLVFMSLVVTSCKKDNRGNTADLEVTSDKTDVYPFEVVFLRAFNHVPELSEYTADFGGISIQVNVVGDSILMFMVPQNVSGSVILALDIDGKKPELTFNVLAAPAITDAAAIVQTFKNNFEIVIDSLTWMSSQAGTTIDQATVQDIQILKTDFDAAVTAASADDLLEFAQMISVNSELFDLDQYLFSHYYGDSLDVMKTSSSWSVPWDRQIARDARLFVGFTLTTIASITIFNGALGTLNPILVAGSTLLLTANVVLLVDQTERILNRTYKAKTLTVSFNKTAVAFETGKSKELSPTAEYRSLVAGDVSGSLVIKSIADALDAIADKWNKIIDYLPSSVANRVSIRRLSQQNSARTNPNILPLSSEFISIENISNPNVSLSSFENVNGELQVTFSSNVTTSQNFTFDIKYNNPWMGPLTQTVSAELLYSIAGVSWLTSPPFGRVGYLFLQSDGTIYWTNSGNISQDGEWTQNGNIVYIHYTESLSGFGSGNVAIVYDYFCNGVLNAAGDEILADVNSVTKYYSIGQVLDSTVNKSASGFIIRQNQ